MRLVSGESHYDDNTEDNPIDAGPSLSPQVSRLLGSAEDDTALPVVTPLPLGTSAPYPSYDLPADWYDTSDVEGYDPEDHDLAQAILATMVDGEGDDGLEAVATSTVGPQRAFLHSRPTDNGKPGRSVRKSVDPVPHLPKDKPGKYHSMPRSGGSGRNFEQEALHQLANVFGGKNQHEYNLPVLKEAYGKLLAAAHQARQILRKARKGQERGEGGHFKRELGDHIIHKQLKRAQELTRHNMYKEKGWDHDKALADEADRIHNRIKKNRERDARKRKAGK